ncbi:MAG: hypothetical protein RLZ98_205 [Pseudomonadota bacterium]|jgi:hypothetical protein
MRNSFWIRLLDWLEVRSSKPRCISRYMFIDGENNRADR